MANRPYNLAIETSGPAGSCSLGVGDRLIASVDLAGRPPAVTNHGRRQQDLMAAIDDLTRTHQVDRTQLGQIYLSIGPGSFTGLRVAVTTAKTMAIILGLQLVAVPTVAAVAENAPTSGEHEPHLAVCLSYKTDTVYAQLFDLVADRWQPNGTAAVQTVEDLLANAPRPLAIIAHPKVVFDPGTTDVRQLPADCLQPHSRAIWSLGRKLAMQNRFMDPYHLVPLYARPPEAQRLWECRQKKMHQNQLLTPEACS